MLSPVEIISRSGLRSDCGSFHKLPGPSRGPGFGKTCVTLGCVRPLQGGRIGCSSPRAPLEGSFRVWPSGTLDTCPAGPSHATPLGGCYVTGHDASPAHAGGRVTPDRGFPPHIPHLRARVSRDRGRCLATPPLLRRVRPRSPHVPSCSCTPFWGVASLSSPVPRLSRRDGVFCGS